MSKRSSWSWRASSTACSPHCRAGSYIYEGADRRHGDQRRHEQPGVRPRFGPASTGRSRPEGLSVTGRASQ